MTTNATTTSMFKRPSVTDKWNGTEEAHPSLRKCRFYCQGKGQYTIAVP